MTSPAEPASTDAPQASQLTKPLRELAAFALLGANAVFLFVGLIRLVTPTEYSTIGSRAGSAFFAFLGFEVVFLPLVAVLLATHVRPPAPKAKLITQVALGEYAVSALIGGLTFLFWTVDRLAEGEILDAFLGLLSRMAYVALFAVAAYVVFKIWRTLYHVPKPKPQPGMYGQPQPGWPQQQGGYPTQGQQAPGQFAPGQSAGYPTSGQQAPGQQGGWQASGPYGAPYGQQATPFPGPQSSPPFSPAPQSAPPATEFAPPAPQSAPPAPQSAPPAPQSGPPAPPAPQSGPPAAAPQFGQPQSAPPFGQSASAEPTQAIPRQSVEPTGPTQPIPGPAADETDRTQRITLGDTPDPPR